MYLRKDSFPCSARKGSAKIISMARFKEVYLPRWQRWFVAPLFGGFWLFFTYMEFFSETEEKIGLVGYLILSAIFSGFGIMMWLMTSGKLPSYIIKED